ncbi:MULTISPECIES: phosphatidylinositol mannoside acyltransferase [Micromonospora]|uniref:phosphatidylinositol mannoside acyltransferase n=1 Tax=Micromonospora TaxID=1873 RepID=UPI0021C80A2D|nr:phosphatidylinositol mannoside acyltransferase [Micromonospora sp. Mcm103]
MNLTEAGFVAGWRLIRALPRPVAAAAFRAGADRAHRKDGGGTRRLRANLRRVVGPRMSDAELDVLVRDGLRSYARYWMEAFRLPGLSRAEILAGFRLDGQELLAADVAAGRGAVVALPHAGNWDAAGAWVAATGWPMTTVAERLPDGVYERFVGFREGLGMEILPNRGGPRPAFDVLVDRLRAGYVVPLLADRDLSARGVEVDFFGGRTRMPAGPALLAIRTGAPLYVASMWYEPDAACASIDGPLPLPDPDSAPLDERVRAVTQRIADGLAAGIARHPQDWHMLQRMWLDQDRDGTPTSPRPPATTGTV